MVEGEYMELSIFLTIITVLYLFIYMLVNHSFGRARLSNGPMFLIGAGLVLTTLYSFARNNSADFILNGILLVSLIAMVLMGFGIFFVIFISLKNGIRMIHREGFSLANALSLFLGIGIILLLILNTKGAEITAGTLPEKIFFVILLLVDISVAYFALLYCNFLFTSFLYSVYRPFRTVQYIIVLGAGLLHGSEVSPLLAGRIDCALKVYKRQIRRKKPAPILIFSGGQGKDEAIPEAEAMKQYAINEGIDEKDVLTEDRSVNTYENMKYSKKIIDAREEHPEKCRILFATTNYHVFRSALYARQNNLKAQGIGSSTKNYYRYNATLREYAAIVKLHLKVYLIILAVFIVMIFALFLLLHFYSSNPDAVNSILSKFGIY
jgi:uncharacterized SAM-binding protein YcdF (DUF218 family)